MKLAVVFPGIGYTVDKPLLYYSKKIAAAHGYEVVDVPYGNFPARVKGDKAKMEASFYSALEQCEELLRDVDYSRYDEILFLSKSIGTAIAAAYGHRHGLTTRNVYFTPVAESFPLMDQPGIVYNGTRDAWVEGDVVVSECLRLRLPLIQIEGANHSLETGDWRRDLQNLRSIMDDVEQYI